MVAQQIMDVISQLSAKLAGPAKELWGIMVIQQARVGVVDLSVGGLLLVVFLAGVWTLVWRVRKTYDHWTGDDVWLAGFAITGLSILLLITIACTVNGFLKLSNPSYYALMDLRNMIPSK